MSNKSLIVLIIFALSLNFLSCGRESDQNNDETLATNDTEYFYFSGNNGTHGRELWKTDGSKSDTVMVKDINPGLAPLTTNNIYDATSLRSCHEIT
jgi:ELWxxDGT repeat protein